MEAAIQLGLQAATERQTPPGVVPGDTARNAAREAAAAPAGVSQPTNDVQYLHKQSSPAFPRPKSGFAPYVALTIVGCTVAAFLWLRNTDSGSVWLASLMVPVVLGVASAFLVSRLRGSLDRGGRYRGLGTVLMTDRAGVVLGEDAQQRALIEVEAGSERFLLVATQLGLALSPGMRVEVSWSREKSETCYVHGA
ncbi:hypothetical protein [Leucobacter chinensis]|uniref:hypothetical protein n=1 Tax=Leucobacter chinensis TaxID=2851010 RepID=UPI001C225693|nr:hypothetical protein [Leucobacter chinensis]